MLVNKRFEGLTLNVFLNKRDGSLPSCFYLCLSLSIIPYPDFLFILYSINNTKMIFNPILYICSIGKNDFPNMNEIARI